MTPRTALGALHIGALMFGLTGVFGKLAAASPAVIEGGMALSMSTRWFSGRAALKISPAKYWKIASLPCPSDSSSVAPRRRKCSRSSTSAATQPSLCR